MIGNYLRLPEAELNRILRDPAAITSVLYPRNGIELPRERHLDIDKAWHLIHFLLTGDEWEGTEPLRNAVLGGAEIGKEDVGYGPARYLTPAQVSNVAVALASIAPDQLWDQFDLQTVREADIYPCWEGNNEDREYILSYFQMLQNFFTVASQENNAVILYLN